MLQAMIERSIIILSILIISVSPKVSGQDKLKDKLVSDSLINKLGIKSVTENWYTKDTATKPANTSYELYNQSGYLTKAVDVNHSYHKAIRDFHYNFKKRIVIKKQIFYDYNHNQSENKADTILKKSKEKFDIATGINKKSKQTRNSKFQQIYTYDTRGRILQSKDTIKCGYKIINYSYDNNNEKINERKHFITHHEEAPTLKSIDSLFYNNKGLLTKEIKYFDFKKPGTKLTHGREKQTELVYNKFGLIQEKKITNIYLRLRTTDSNSSFYKYEYEFY